MSKVRVRMSSKGSREMLNGREIQQDILGRAEAIKSRAESMGSGRYEADVRPGVNRAHAMVKTTDARSMASNAKHNSLLKSLGAGKDA